MGEACNFALPDWLGLGVREDDTSSVGDGPEVMTTVDPLPPRSAARLRSTGARATAATCVSRTTSCSATSRATAATTRQRRASGEQGGQSREGRAPRYPCVHTPAWIPRSWSCSICAELEHVIRLEARERTALIADDGVATQIHLTNEADPRYECLHCHYVCYLSAVICRCAAARRKVACLRHARLLCACPPSQRILVFWYDLAALRVLQDAATQWALLHGGSSGGAPSAASPKRETLALELGAAAVAAVPGSPATARS